MKRLVLIVLLLVLPVLVYAGGWERNYVCTSRYGTEAGYGRLSKAGEYSSYWKKKAKAGEFVIFQYKPHGKKYWFHAYKCKPIVKIKGTGAGL